MRVGRGPAFLPATELAVPVGLGHLVVLLDPEGIWDFYRRLVNIPDKVTLFPSVSEESGGVGYHKWDIR